MKPPSARERKEDILPLAESFLERFVRETKKSFTALSEDAPKKRLAYDWPGNVRELVNVIERAVILGRGPKITVQDLPATIAAKEQRKSSDKLLYREALEGFRRELITRALAESQGNRAAAARALGLHEKYLWRLLKSLRIA